MTQLQDDDAASPVPVYVMYPADTSESIDLVEVLVVLWKRKLLILAITIACATGGAAYAFLATPSYRAEAVLAPTQTEGRSDLPSGLTGLAGLAGVSIGASRDATQEIAMLRSRVFIEEFIDENNLLPVLLADQWDSENERWLSEDPDEWPDIRDGVEFFANNVRSVSEDRETGLVTVAIEWTDAETTASWLENLVLRINERLRARDLADSRRRLEYLNGQLEQAGLVELRQAISSLIEDQVETIMLAQAETEYAFRVIDPPRVPREPVSPRRALIVVLSGFAGGVLGCIGALLRCAAEYRRGRNRLSLSS